MEIRLAKLSDLDSIINIFKQLLDFNIPLVEREMWFLNKKEIKNRIKSKEGIIAINNGKIVGHLFFENYREPTDIDTIIVDKKYRKKGIGRKLIEYFINKAKNKNIDKIILGTYRCFKCEKFYYKLGFSLFSIQPYRKICLEMYKNL